MWPGSAGCWERAKDPGSAGVSRFATLPRSGGDVRGLVWAAVVVAGAVAVAALDRDSGIGTRLRLGEDVDAAELRIASLRDDVEALKALVASLESDPFAIERAIREELAYARRGETVVRLTPIGPATPQNP